jgi:hypothetical protein
MKMATGTARLAGRCWRLTKSVAGQGDGLGGFRCPGVPLLYVLLESPTDSRVLLLLVARILVPLHTGGPVHDCISFGQRGTHTSPVIHVEWRFRQ